MSWAIVQGDATERPRELSDASIDAVVTDPPYEIGFMGKKWDSTGIAFSVELWREILRVLKPGGHLLAFGGTRTYHRIACAIEDAGFEVRDTIAYMFGSGFPKSLSVSKAIDKASGAERRVTSVRTDGVGNTIASLHKSDGFAASRSSIYEERAEAATAAAASWDGWGTALKPAFEPVIVARKPLEGTVAANVLRYGTGAINVDGCRIGDEERRATTTGRWPANVILDEEAAAMLGEPSRFFYTAKPSRRERDFGLDAFPSLSGGAATDREDDSLGARCPGADAGRTGGARNPHPTVKPVSLMKYLVRLVTPPRGIVLDPFVGSGTTGIAAVKLGFDFVGIDLSPEYVRIAEARVAAWAARGEP